MFETAALGTVNRFDIAKILPEDGKAMHIRDIAEQGGADEERLRTYARTLPSCSVCVCVYGMHTD